MASRLFHAVVGIGISLGAAGATAACVVDAKDPADTKGGSEGTEPPGAAPTTPPNSTPSAPTGPAADGGEGQAADAGADVADRFCDAVWPTTKGSIGPDPACIDPNQECGDAGPPEPCYVAVGVEKCEHMPMYSTTCIDGVWQCAPGKKKAAACKCWSPSSECN